MNVGCLPSSTLTSTDGVFEHGSNGRQIIDSVNLENVLGVWVRGNLRHLPHVAPGSNGHHHDGDPFQPGETSLLQRGDGVVGTTICEEDDQVLDVVSVAVVVKDVLPCGSQGIGRVGTSSPGEQQVI